MDKREARKWIRRHFAFYIANSDIGHDTPSDVVEAVWGDECRRIAARLDPEGWGKSPTGEAGDAQPSRKPNP